jgi:hypothetical protein
VAVLDQQQLALTELQTQVAVVAVAVLATGAQAAPVL